MTSMAFPPELGKIRYIWWKSKPSFALEVANAQGHSGKTEQSEQSGKLDITVAGQRNIAMRSLTCLQFDTGP
jgi:hypothetical protein